MDTKTKPPRDEDLEDEDKEAAARAAGLVDPHRAAGLNQLDGLIDALQAPFAEFEASVAPVRQAVRDFVRSAPSAEAQAWRAFFAGHLVHSRGDALALLISSGLNLEESRHVRPFVLGAIDKGGES